MTLLVSVGAAMMSLLIPVAPSPPSNTAPTARHVVSSAQRPEDALCFAVDYLLTHYRKNMQQDSAFLVAVDDSASSSRQIAARLAPHYPQFAIRAVKDTLPPHKFATLGIHAWQWQTSNSVIVPVSVTWGRKSGFGMRLLITLKDKQWQVSKIFGEYEI